MFFYRLVPLFVFVLGGVAGLFRTMELKSGFTDKGLTIPGDPWRIAVLVISAAVFLLCLFFSVNMGVPKKRNSPLVFVEFRPFALGSYCFAFFSFLVAGGLNIFWALRYSGMAWFISGVLLILSSFSLLLIGLLLRKSRFQKDLSFLALVPVFWSCYHLILHFREDTQNPVIAQYMISVFAMAFLVLLFHAETGMLFNKKCARRLYFTSMMCMFFNTVYLFETVQRFLNALSVDFKLADFGNVISALIAFAGIFFSVFCLLSLLRKRVPTEFESVEG